MSDFPRLSSISSGVSLTQARMRGGCSKLDGRRVFVARPEQLFPLMTQVSLEASANAKPLTTFIG